MITGYGGQAARKLDELTPLSAALESTEGKAILQAALPELMGSPYVAQVASMPLGNVLRFALAPDRARAEAVIEEISRIDDPRPPRAEPAAVVPAPDYEADSVPRGSAAMTLSADAAQHRIVELSFTGPSHANPFVDVDLVAEFISDGQTLRVGGFYDGDGTYRIRFLPPTAGTWQYATTSNARSLDGITGIIEVAATTDRGPVRVDGLHFTSADGAAFHPIGTTAYAWVHQPDELQERTLASLAAAPFTKLRMGLFPKHFVYNSNEPDRFVFPRDDDGAFDFTRFDVEFFARLEHRIQQLADIGVEADLILFHPYDHWGFADMGQAADDRYVRYVVRRLAAFPTVWWAMTNEYDLITSKRADGWHRLGRIVREEDHVGHPVSIHNWDKHFDHTADWVTHASIQINEPRLAAKVDEWRLAYGKPIVIDEFGYDGDLEEEWGNLTSEEVVRRVWDITLRGGYATHGETFWAEDEVVFWAKGGELKGESIPRIAFLKELVSSSPTGRLDPIRADVVSGGVPGQYVLAYFGSSRPRFRTLMIPQGMRARVELIDTWNMTIEEIPGVHEGFARVELGSRPYMAVRLRPADGEDR